MKSKFSILILFTIIIASAFIFNQKASPGGLKVGDKAPNFSGVDFQGKSFKLSKALEKGPVVIFFYRGQWCPFCNRYIKGIQDSLPVIMAKGASVIGISPEKPEGMAKTVKKSGVTFPLLQDEGNIIAIKYRGVDVTANSDDTVPVPATYIVGKDGLIKFVHFDPNYQQRASIKDILSNL